MKAIEQYHAQMRIFVTDICDKFDLPCDQLPWSNSCLGIKRGLTNGGINSLPSDEAP